jgi:mercuric ion transport protein
MKSKTMIKAGIVGTVITALCCFTPVLVILLGAVGFSALVGYLDYVLIPALLVFLGILAYGFSRKSKEVDEECCTSIKQG